MPPVGFEPTISAGERPQTYALDRVATGTDIIFRIHSIILVRGAHKPKMFSSVVKKTETVNVM